MRPSRKCLGVLVFALSLALAGCGKPTATIKGKVYLQTTPLKGGNVTFVSTEGKGDKSVHIEEDGSFTLLDVPLGEGKFCVETESLNPSRHKKMPYTAPPGMKNPNNTGGVDLETLTRRYMPIPLRYADPGHPELKYTVTKSETHDVLLEGP